MAVLSRHRSAAKFFLGACLFAGVPAQALELSGAWVRAMPPGRPMTAAYMTVHNDGDAAVTVTAVSSPLGEASLHETRVVDGRSRMDALPTLRLDPGATVELTPGGMHIMLMGLATTPAKGDRVPLCLETDKGQFCVEAPVQSDAGQTMHHHH